MRRVGAKDTKLEMVVRRVVHGLGYRYRLHRRRLAGYAGLGLYRETEGHIRSRSLTGEQEKDKICTSIYSQVMKELQNRLQASPGMGGRIVRGGPQSLDRQAAELRWNLLFIGCCLIESVYVLSFVKRAGGWRGGLCGREARERGQAVGNAQALSTGCPCGPQGAGRSEGLVHKIHGAERAECSAVRPGYGVRVINFSRRQVQALDAGVRLRRRQAAERGVRAFVVVIPHPGADPVASLAEAGKRPQAHALVLQRAPQPLDERVVAPLALAVHRDADAARRQLPGPRRGGELAALVGVEHLRRAAAVEGLGQRVHAKQRVLGRGQPPRQHLARMPVHDRHQVQKPMRHRHIRQVGAPRLVGPAHRQVAQQVRIHPTARRPARGVRPRRHRAQAHHPHQPPHPLAARRMAHAPQRAGHLPGAIPRAVQIQLVHHPHQPKVLLRLARRAVVEARAGDAHQSALARHAQPFALRINQAPPPTHAQRSKALAKKSRSTTSSPIFA